MSHDRGCYCGREKYEYHDCPISDCWNKKDKIMSGDKIGPVQGHGAKTGRWDGVSGNTPYSPAGDMLEKIPEENVETSGVKRLVPDPVTGQGCVRGDPFDGGFPGEGPFGDPTTWPLPPSPMPEPQINVPTCWPADPDYQQDVHVRLAPGMPPKPNVDAELRATIEALAKDRRDEEMGEGKNGGGWRMNAGKLRADLMPPEWEWALADVLTKGAMKYADRNWEKGMGWASMIGCVKRHVNKFLAGERYDGPKYDREKGTTGCHHLAMAAWNCLALMTYDLRQIGKNDLPSGLTIQLLERVNAESSDLLEKIHGTSDKK